MLTFHPVPSPPVVVDISSDQPTIRVGEGVLIRQGQLRIDGTTIAVVAVDAITHDGLGASVLWRDPRPEFRGCSRWPGFHVEKWGENPPLCGIFHGFLGYFDPILMKYTEPNQQLMIVLQVVFRNRRCTSIIASFGNANNDKPLEFGAIEFREKHIKRVHSGRVGATDCQPTA